MQSNAIHFSVCPAHVPNRFACAVLEQLLALWAGSVNDAGFGGSGGGGSSLVVAYVLARRIQPRTRSRLHSTGATRCIPDRCIRVDPALPVEVCRPNYTLVFAVS